MLMPVKNTTTAVATRLRRVGLRLLALRVVPKHVSLPTVFLRPPTLPIRPRTV
jgi:hypothetical protein